MYSPIRPKGKAVTSIKICYVSLHRFSYLIADSLSQFTELTVLGLWAPKRLSREVFSFINIGPIKRMLARDFTSSPKNYNFKSSIILETILRLRNERSILFIQLISIPFSYFFQRKLSKYIKRNEISIIPADIWDLVHVKLRSQVLLEVRWLTHHLVETLEIPKQVYHSDIASGKTAIPEISVDDLSQFCGFITYSNIGKESLILSGVRSENILLAPLSPYVKNPFLGISIEKRAERILYVGRSAPEKRLDLAVEISESLKIPIDIVGKFDLNTITWLTKKKYVNFIGPLPIGDVLQIMQKNKYFVAPGAESWGLSVIEALDNGMEVFASRFTGAVEWISHPNLVVIPNMSCDLFVRAMKRIKINQTNDHFRNLANESDEIWRNYIKNLQNNL